MSLVHSLFSYIPLLPSQRQSSSPTIFPKSPFKNPRKPHYVIACLAPKALPTSEQEILEAVAESDGKSLPCVRSYENDLARLTLVGAVDFEQALTAAAADGGEAAGEHIVSGMAAMVVETVYPGVSGEHSTVSTRLFLPARKVKEKAKKLRSSLNEDILSSTTSSNILAMTFRQVVLQHLWNFELVLFRPGTERKMEDLENSREQVPASFTLSSSDERVISVLAEVVCISALESTERHFIENSFGKTSNSFFHWFHKPKRIISKDSSVILYKLFEDEIVQNAKSLLENFESVKANYKRIGTKPKYYWWTSSAYSKLEKIGGPEFTTWTSEYIPAYRLQIDAGRLKNVKLEGWKNYAKNRWEVLLTHSQMVELANVLDMYYEDLYTLPDKQLSCGVLANSTNLYKNKRSSSMLKLLSVSLASGIFLVTIGVLGQIFLPHIHKGKKYTRNHYSIPSSEVDYTQHQALDATKLEAFCISTVKKIKDAFGWPGDIMTETSVGAWIGELPIYLKMLGKPNYNSEDIPTNSSPLEESNADMTASVQDIASYQVVLSIDGKIVGFQPTSQVAVNHWATNPLAKELYGGRKLSPGFIEPGLKIHYPNEVVVIELLMSENPEAYFALARPVQ
ncbi:hypothetical protein L1049_010296 [Liquidambar formosana]|uniref:Uncharacterized protein n=1 Tax=Liquidambar formosana TaxID=63359 RepID=A0AAP0NB74_LIQFO